MNRINVYKQFACVGFTFLIPVFFLLGCYLVKYHVVFIGASLLSCVGLGISIDHTNKWAYPVVTLCLILGAVVALPFLLISFVIYLMYLPFASFLTLSSLSTKKFIETKHKGHLVLIVLMIGLLIWHYLENLN